MFGYSAFLLLVIKFVWFKLLLHYPAWIFDRDHGITLDVRRAPKRFMASCASSSAISLRGMAVIAVLLAQNAEQTSSVLVKTFKRYPDLSRAPHLLVAH
jgi:hypothetical protein